MTGWSGKAMSGPREKLNARDDKLPFKENGPDQLWWVRCIQEGSIQHSLNRVQLSTKWILNKNLKSIGFEVALGYSTLLGKSWRTGKHLHFSTCPHRTPSGVPKITAIIKWALPMSDTGLSNLWTRLVLIYKSTLEDRHYYYFIW